MKEKILLFLLTLCIFLSSCQSKEMTNKMALINKIHLIKCGYTKGKIEVDATVEKSSDIKKIQNILKNFTKSSKVLNDLTGAVYYEIVLEQNDNKKNSYSICQLTKDNYVLLKADGKDIYHFNDRNGELSNLFEKYFKCKNPF